MVDNTQESEIHFTERVISLRLKSVTIFDKLRTNLTIRRKR